MEGSPGNPPALEVDAGLDYLFPLYSFLHDTAQVAVCCLLMESFGDAQYVKENIGRCVKSHMTLNDFLCHVNQTIKNMTPDEPSKKNKRRNTQPQALANSRQAPQCSGGQQNTRPPEIQNVKEKEKILVKLTVGELLQKNKKVCQVLQELDLNFVLSILLHKLIDFRLEQDVKEALGEMKKVRLTLVHAKYHFSKMEFDSNLEVLEKAVGTVRKALHLSDQQLQDRVTLCRDEANSGNQVHKIICKLHREAHRQYCRPDSSFLCPTISYSPTHHREVIEDVQKFIEMQQDDLEPILLCGEYKEEKTLVFEKLAFKAKDSKRYCLVLYLKDSHRRSYCHQLTPSKNCKKVVQEFQNQLNSCLKNLAPSTFYEYGEDAVKTAIRIYQKNILFLIDWNVSVWGPVQSEMQRGTWVMSCNAKEPPKGSWQTLRLEPYTDLQVREMLQHLPNARDLLRCYDCFNCQNILCSLDMIKIFCEVNKTICCGTDFEVVKMYVSETERCARSEVRQVDLLRLGKLAFCALCSGNHALEAGKLVDIQECVCNAFLKYIESGRWYFNHSIVRDFLAAKYMVSDLKVTCRNWVKRDENVASFMRVFKFACYMLSEDGSRIKEQSLEYMETFLRTLLHAPDKRSQGSDRGAKSGDQKLNQKKKRAPQEYENKLKYPFDCWDFLLELDSACTEKLLKRIISVLSDISCWHFSDTGCLDATKLTRLGRVLNKVALSKKNPVIIKLKSSANVALLTKLWRMFRGIGSLYGCVDLVVTIDGNDADYSNYKDKLEEFLGSIADAQAALHISKYRGPLFSCCIPSFFKCMCMHYLKILEVSVYDIKSLREVMMACRTLPSLQEVFIRVNLSLTEQAKLPEFVVPIEFPEKISMHITFKYFPQIQLLLDIFERCDRLCSLSIHELSIVDGFKLNLSKYSNLESLNIRCEPKCSGERDHTAETDQMVVDEPDRPWMLPFLNGLVLPQKVERLLLRNVDFITDSYQSFIIRLLEKYNINRLLILDTQLSLSGVGQLLCSQTEVEEDVTHDRERKLRRHESQDIRKLGQRRPRISKEEREARKWNKPDGKEIVITSEGLLCADCSCFPCMCESKVDRIEGRNSFERMVEVISDMHRCSIQTFSYSFNHCTIRKDMCGDLRVQCIMKGLNDSAILEIDSRPCIKRFFLPLLLAHSVTLEKTALSPVGVANVAEYLQLIRGTREVDPFSLIIETSWHPPQNSSSFEGLKDFLKRAEYLSVVHFWCNCKSKCFHVKKTYQGNVEELV